LLDPSAPKIASVFRLLFHAEVCITKLRQNSLSEYTFFHGTQLCVRALNRSTIFFSWTYQSGFTVFRHFHLKLKIDPTSL